MSCLVAGQRTGGVEEEKLKLEFVLACLVRQESSEQKAGLSLPSPGMGHYQQRGFPPERW